MKERIDTIPLNDAFDSGDECPFCYLDRFVLKHDYRNGDLPWENSRDAVSRGMQKIRGGHPADPVFRSSDFGAQK